VVLLALVAGGPLDGCWNSAVRKERTAMSQIAILLDAASPSAHAKGPSRRLLAGSGGGGAFTFEVGPGSTTLYISYSVMLHSTADSAGYLPDSPRALRSIAHRDEPALTLSSSPPPSLSMQEELFTIISLFALWGAFVHSTPVPVEIIRLALS
jgi:hypothetical protein